MDRKKSPDDHYTRLAPVIPQSDGRCAIPGAGARFPELPESHRFAPASAKMGPGINWVRIFYHSECTFKMPSRESACAAKHIPGGRPQYLIFGHESVRPNHRPHARAASLRLRAQLGVGGQGLGSGQKFGGKSYGPAARFYSAEGQRCLFFILLSIRADSAGRPRVRCAQAGNLQFPWQPRWRFVCSSRKFQARIHHPQSLLQR